MKCKYHQFTSWRSFFPTRRRCAENSQTDRARKQTLRPRLLEKQAERIALETGAGAQQQSRVLCFIYFYASLDRRVCRLYSSIYLCSNSRCKRLSSYSALLP